VKQRIERVCQWVKDGKPLPSRSGGKRRSHPALPWQELPQFMTELRTRESVSARALEFTVLTAARTGEVIGATWDEIDLDAKVWTIPAERMKATREHRVPLSARAVKILQSLPREGDFVFIGSRKGEGLSNMAMLELVRGMRSGVTTHGFRSTFTDWAHETTSTPRTVVEAALAHVVADKTEAAYRRGDLLTKRHKLMTEWARYCQRKTAEVVTMPKKRNVTA
jgi:integrase